MLKMFALPCRWHEVHRSRERDYWAGMFARISQENVTVSKTQGLRLTGKMGTKSGGHRQRTSLLIDSFMMYSLSVCWLRMGVYTDSLGVHGAPTWQRAQEVYHPAPTGFLMMRLTRPPRNMPPRESPFEATAVRDATISMDTSLSGQRAYGTTAHRASANQRRKRKRRRKRMLMGRAHLSLACRTWT